VLASGDGLIFEAINGILSRPDVARDPSIAQRIALVHLPGGTSNGLAASVGTETVAGAALAIAKHLVVPWDATAVDVRSMDSKTEGGHPTTLWRGFSFGILAWAVSPDIDIGTEGMRWMGQARIEVGAATLLLKGKTYPGKVALGNTPIPALGQGEELLGSAALDSVDPSQLKTLDAESYYMWSASKFSVVDPSFLITPKARGWSGSLNNVSIYGHDFSRMRALKSFEACEKGVFPSDMWWVHFEDSTSVVVTPGSNTKYMTVDGDPVPIGEMRGVVLPGALRVLCAPQVHAEWAATQAAAPSS